MSNINNNEPTADEMYTPEESSQEPSETPLSIDQIIATQLAANSRISPAEEPTTEEVLEQSVSVVQDTSPEEEIPFSSSDILEGSREMPSDKDIYEESLEGARLSLCTHDKESLMLKIKAVEKEMTELLSSADRNTFASKEEAEAATERFRDLGKLLDDIVKNYIDAISFNNEAIEAAVSSGEHLDNRINKDLTVATDLSAVDTSSYSEDKLNNFIHLVNENVRMTNLANSGFLVTLKEPNLRQINDLFNKLHSKFSEKALQYGAFFFELKDILVVETMWNFVRSLIMASNLIGWKDPARLGKAVTIHDLDVLIHSLSCQQYPEGYEYTIECAYDDCRHRETAIVDLEKFKYTNISKFTSDFKKRLETKKLNEQQVAQYQSDLGLNYTFREGIYKFELKVPSVSEFIEYGLEFEDEMRDYFSDKKEISQNDVDMFTQMNYYRLFVPWISKIYLMNGDDVKNTMTATSLKVNILDHFSTRSVDITHHFRKFIKESKLTHIAYYGGKCSKCQREHPGAKNGYISIDPTQSFFYQCLLFLIKKSSATSENTTSGS